MIFRLMRRLWLFSLLTVVSMLSSGCGHQGRKEPLNFVFIIVDDLGWKDLGIYGSDFYETPNIDRLARKGMRFSQFYTAGCVCSPTRASLLSGKHPARLNITDWIRSRQPEGLLPPLSQQQLPLDEYTLGEAFQDYGYLTGYIGKWHLGRRPYFPDRQGFDFTLAVSEAGLPATYFYPYRNEEPSPQDVPDLESGTPGEYLTDRLTEEAIRFLRDTDSRPFFLMLSHYAVHIPLEAKQELAEKYQRKADEMESSDRAGFAAEGKEATTKLVQDDPVYGAMVESVDESVGHILAALEDLGIAGRTAVILVSDNGGLSTRAGDRHDMSTANLPLRAGKGWLYEGGIRVPLIISWPGSTPAGSESDTPVFSTDLFPTLLEMGGFEPRSDDDLDGVSLVPLLTGASSLHARSLFWHYPHSLAGNTPSGAIRVGDFKLIQWFETDRVELYNLAEDIGESHDLASQKPQKVRQLRALLEQWRKEVGARMPVPNPACCPAE